jgi:hypothetical protein
LRYTRDCLVRLILASGRGPFLDSWSVMTRRLKSTLHILPYPVDLLWAKSTDVLSCTTSLEVVLNEVVWESSGKSSGGRVGYQLGRLGPQIGRRVF